jgi:hypothetical protein
MSVETLSMILDCGGITRLVPRGLFLKSGEYPGPDSNRHGLAAKGF